MRRGYLYKVFGATILVGTIVEMILTAMLLGGNGGSIGEVIYLMVVLSAFSVTSSYYSYSSATCFVSQHADKDSIT